jgi:hypothetical protein
MDQKSPIKFWHRVGALLLGYLAAALTYELLQIVLAYPIGALSGATGSPHFSLEIIRGVAALAAIVIWIIVYLTCIRIWSKEKHK